MVNTAQTRIPSTIAEVVWSIAPLKVAIWNHLLDLLEKRYDLLALSNGGSLLKENKLEDMTSFDGEKVLAEMNEFCPELLDIFLCIAVPSNVDEIKNWNFLVQRVCLCYSLALQNRNSSLSLIRRILTVLCIEGGISKKVCC